MGIIHCHKHGEFHTVLLVCEHLRDATLSGQALPAVFRVEAYYLEILAGIECLCPTCAAKNGITQNATVWRDDDSLDRIADLQCDIKPVCSKCFDEATEKQKDTISDKEKSL